MLTMLLLLCFFFFFCSCRAVAIFVVILLSLLFQITSFARHPSASLCCCWRWQCSAGLPYASPPQRLVEPELLLRSQIGDAQRCPSYQIYFISLSQFWILESTFRAKPACPRPTANRNGFGTFGRTSEDCLYLNIFTKNLKQSQVSFLHGCNNFMRQGLKT